MGHFIPYFGNQQQHIAAADIDDAMKDALLAIARDGDTALLPDAAVATVERRRLSDDDLVQHQDDTALALKQSMFQPPLACRHVFGRKANWCRGRFQRTRKRAMARRTLSSETTSLCSSRKYSTRSGAVQTVER